MKSIIWFKIITILNGTTFL